MNKEFTNLEVVENPTEIWGLKYAPSLFLNGKDLGNLDSLESHFPHLYSERHTHNIQCLYSECNRTAAKALCEKIQPKLILELGIGRSFYNTSSTKIFNDYVRDTENAHYVGVDLVLTNVPRDHDRIHFLQENTHNYDRIWEFCRSLGFETIDLLHIDADHSINSVLGDFWYAQYISKGGGVLFHDTCVHPPKFVFEAIDESLFRKTVLCDGRRDWGSSVAVRL